MPFEYNKFKTEIEKQVIELWKEVKRILADEKFSKSEEAKQLLLSLKKYLISKFAMNADAPPAAEAADFIDTVVRKVSSNNFYWTDKEEWAKLDDQKRKEALNKEVNPEQQLNIIQADKLTAAQVASCFIGNLQISSNIGKHFRGKEMKRATNTNKGYTKRKITLYGDAEYENVAKDLISKQFIRWFNSLVDQNGHLKTKFTRPNDVRPVSWTVRDARGQKITVSLRDDILVKLLSVRRVIGRGFLGSIRVGVYTPAAKNLIFGCYAAKPNLATYKAKFWHLKNEAKAAYELVMKNDNLETA